MALNLWAVFTIIEVLDEQSYILTIPKNSRILDE